MGQKEANCWAIRYSRDPVLVAESWPSIYVPNLSHAETRSLKPSRAKVGAMRGVKQPLTLSWTAGVRRSRARLWWAGQMLGPLELGGKATQKVWPNLKDSREELKLYTQRQRSRWIPVGYLAVVNPQITPHTLLSPCHRHLSSNPLKKVLFLPHHCHHHLPKKNCPITIIVWLWEIKLQ